MAAQADKSIPQDENLSEQEISELDTAMSETRAEASASTEPRAYDFARSDKLSRKNLRALEMVYAEIARGWSKTLSNSLNNETLVEVNPNEQAAISDYVASAQDPRIAVELSMDSLPGSVFVDMPALLALSLVDRMAGGSGRVNVEARALTEIERNIVKRLAAKLMTDVSAALRPVTAVRFSVSKYYDTLADVEMDGQELVLVARTEWSVLDAKSEVNLIIPVRSLYPTLDELIPQRWLTVESEERGASTSIEGLLRSVELTLTVELGKARVAFEDAIHMEVGDVIRLNKNVDDALEAAIDGRVMFYVRPGLMRNRLSVQIENRADAVTPANNAANTQGDTKSYAGAA